MSYAAHDAAVCVRTAALLWRLSQRVSLLTALLLLSQRSACLSQHSACLSQHSACLFPQLSALFSHGAVVSLLFSRPLFALLFAAQLGSRSLCLSLSLSLSSSSSSSLLSSLFSLLAPPHTHTHAPATPRGKNQCGRVAGPTSTVTTATCTVSPPALPLCTCVVHRVDHGGGARARSGTSGQTAERTRATCATPILQNSTTYMRESRWRKLYSSRADLASVSLPSVASGVCESACSDGTFRMIRCKVRACTPGMCWSTSCGTRLYTVGASDGSTPTVAASASLGSPNDR